MRGISCDVAAYSSFSAASCSSGGIGHGLGHRGLLENVADALVGARQALRFRHRAEDPDRLQSGNDLVDAGGVLADHRLDLVLREAALAEVVAQAAPA